MNKKHKSVSTGRWFLNNHLWMLANSDEIREAARAAKVRLVDASLRQPDEKEAAGKPEEILKKVEEKGSLDSVLTPQQLEDAEKLKKEVDLIEAAKIAAKLAAKEEAEAEAAAAALVAQRQADAEQAEKAKKAAEAKAKAQAKAEAEAASKAAADEVK